jgi:molybdopterin-guanine dinucleotide biosynthesis protein A
MGGIDKTMLDVGGVTILDRVLGTLTAAGIEPLVVVGEPRPVSYDVQWTREQPPGGGPVAGLAAGLAEVTAPCVMAVAGDLPFLDAATVEKLRAAVGAPSAASGLAGAIVVDATGRDQPLVGCWSTESLRAALPSEPAGTSMWRLLAPLQLARIPAGLPLLDCDTPYELDLARAIAARKEDAREGQEEP